MTPLFKKLNYKDQPTIVVLNAPESFDAELAQLNAVNIVTAADQCEQIDFCLAFVTELAQLEPVAAAVRDRSQGDVTFWVAYPKKSSKRYQSEINRDIDWQPLGAIGVEPVRQVAIDADWSALRFRRVAYIKQMKRSKLGAISAEGQQRLDAQ